jgi:hypothetical protein
MSARNSVLREGVLAGIIGAAIVALWFLVLDVGRGQPLFTPALLGTAVFRGATDPGALQIALGPVLGYTLIHVGAFVGFGVVAASLLATSEREPPMFIAFVVLFAAFEVRSSSPRAARPLVARRWSGGGSLGRTSSRRSACSGSSYVRTLARPRPGRRQGPCCGGHRGGLLGAAVMMVWFLVSTRCRRATQDAPGSCAGAPRRRIRSVRYSRIDGPRRGLPRVRAGGAIW